MTVALGDPYAPLNDLSLALVHWPEPLPNSHSITCVALDLESGTFATGNSLGWIYLWKQSLDSASFPSSAAPYACCIGDVKAAAKVSNCFFLHSPVKSITSASDVNAKLLCSYHADGTIRWWDVADGRCLHALSLVYCLGSPALHLTLLPDSRFLACATSRCILIIDVWVFVPAILLVFNRNYAHELNLSFESNLVSLPFDLVFRKVLCKGNPVPPSFDLEDDDDYDDLQDSEQNFPAQDSGLIPFVDDINSFARLPDNLCIATVTSNRGSREKQSYGCWVAATLETGEVFVWNLTGCLDCWKHSHPYLSPGDSAPRADQSCPEKRPDRARIKKFNSFREGVYGREPIKPSVSKAHLQLHTDVVPADSVFVNYSTCYIENDCGLLQTRPTCSAVIDESFCAIRDDIGQVIVWFYAEPALTLPITKPRPRLILRSNSKPFSRGTPAKGDVRPKSLSNSWHHFPHLKRIPFLCCHTIQTSTGACRLPCKPSETALAARLSTTKTRLHVSIIQTVKQIASQTWRVLEAGSAADRSALAAKDSKRQTSTACLALYTRQGLVFLSGVSTTTEQPEWAVIHLCHLDEYLLPQDESEPSCAPSISFPVVSDILYCCIVAVDCRQPDILMLFTFNFVASCNRWCAHRRCDLLPFRALRCSGVEPQQRNARSHDVIAQVAHEKRGRIILTRSHNDGRLGQTVLCALECLSEACQLDHPNFTEQREPADAGTEFFHGPYADFAPIFPPIEGEGPSSEFACVPDSAVDSSPATGADYGPYAPPDTTDARAKTQTTDDDDDDDMSDTPSQYKPLVANAHFWVRDVSRSLVKINCESAVAHDYIDLRDFTSFTNFDMLETASSSKSAFSKDAQSQQLDAALSRAASSCALRSPRKSVRTKILEFFGRKTPPSEIDLASCTDGGGFPGYTDGAETDTTSRSGSLKSSVHKGSTRSEGSLGRSGSASSQQNQALPLSSCDFGKSGPKSLLRTWSRRIRRQRSQPVMGNSYSDLETQDASVSPGQTTHGRRDFRRKKSLLWHRKKSIKSWMRRYNRKQSTLSESLPSQPRDASPSRSDDVLSEGQPESHEMISKFSDHNPQSQPLIFKPNPGFNQETVSQPLYFTPYFTAATTQTLQGPVCWTGPLGKTMNGLSKESAGFDSAPSFRDEETPLAQIADDLSVLPGQSSMCLMGPHRRISMDQCLACLPLRPRILCLLAMPYDKLVGGSDMGDIFVWGSTPFSLLASYPGLHHAPIVKLFPVHCLHRANTWRSSSMCVSADASNLFILINFSRVKSFTSSKPRPAFYPHTVACKSARGRGRFPYSPSPAVDEHLVQIQDDWWSCVWSEQLCLLRTTLSAQLGGHFSETHRDQGLAERCAYRLMRHPDLFCEDVLQIHLLADRHHLIFVTPSHVAVFNLNSNMLTLLFSLADFAVYVYLCCLKLVSRIEQPQRTIDRKALQQTTRGSLQSLLHFFHQQKLTTSLQASYPQRHATERILGSSCYVPELLSSELWSFSGSVSDEKSPFWFTQIECGQIYSEDLRGQPYVSSFQIPAVCLPLLSLAPPPSETHQPFPRWTPFSPFLYPYEFVSQLPSKYPSPVWAEFIRSLKSTYQRLSSPFFHAIVGACFALTIPLKVRPLQTCSLSIALTQFGNEKSPNLTFLTGPPGNVQSVTSVQNVPRDLRSLLSPDTSSWFSQADSDALVLSSKNSVSAAEFFATQDLASTNEVRPFRYHTVYYRTKPGAGVHELHRSFEHLSKTSDIQDTASSSAESSVKSAGKNHWPSFLKPTQPHSRDDGNVCINMPWRSYKSFSDLTSLGVDAGVKTSTEARRTGAFRRQSGANQTPFFKGSADLSSKQEFWASFAHAGADGKQRHLYSHIRKNIPSSNQNLLDSSPHPAHPSGALMISSLLGQTPESALRGLPLASGTLTDITSSPPPLEPDPQTPQLFVETFANSRQCLSAHTLVLSCIAFEFLFLPQVLKARALGKMSQTRARKEKLPTPEAVETWLRQQFCLYLLRHYDAYLATSLPLWAALQVHPASEAVRTCARRWFHFCSERTGDANAANLLMEVSSFLKIYEKSYNSIIFSKMVSRSPRRIVPYLSFMPFLTTPCITAASSPVELPCREIYYYDNKLIFLIVLAQLYPSHPHNLKDAQTLGFEEPLRVMILKHMLSVYEIFTKQSDGFPPTTLTELPQITVGLPSIVLELLTECLIASYGSVWHRALFDLGTCYNWKAWKTSIGSASAAADFSSEKVYGPHMHLQKSPLEGSISQVYLSVNDIHYRSQYQAYSYFVGSIPLNQTRVELIHTLIFRLYTFFLQYPDHKLLTAFFSRLCLEIGWREPPRLLRALDFATKKPSLGHVFVTHAMSVMTDFFMKYTSLCVTHLPSIVRSIVKCLTPSNPGLRRATLKHATAALFQLVQAFPMATFHQESQRFAIGTTDGLIIIYDLRTATRWKIIEAHGCHIFALKISDDGSLIASYSPTEQTFSLWQASLCMCGLPPLDQCTSVGFLDGILGAAGKCIKSVHLPKIPKGYSMSPIEQLRTVRILYKSDRDWILRRWEKKLDLHSCGRENGKAYVVRL